MHASYATLQHCLCNCHACTTAIFLAHAYQNDCDGQLYLSFIIAISHLFKDVAIDLSQHALVLCKSLSGEKQSKKF